MYSVTTPQSGNGAACALPHGVTALCEAGDGLCTGACSQDSDCNNHGSCVGEVCSCDAGWDGGKCTNPQDCSSVAPPGFGTMGDCAQQLSHGESCDFQCSPGYNLVSSDGGSGRQYCSAGSMGPTVVCEPQPCTIAIPDNGNWGDCPDTGVLEHGASCAFECDPGYGLSQQPSCNAGDPGPALPCTPMACPVVPEPSYETGVAHTTGMGTCADGIAHGRSCTVGCSPGYFMTGSQPSCLFGEVTHSMYCRGSSCSQPFDLPEHATYGNCPTTMSHGTFCQLACEPGYTIITGGVMCNARSANTQATCVPNDCAAGAVAAPAHGTLGECSADGSLEHGVTCDLACDEGYTLVGSQPVCTAGDVSSAVSCVPSDCSGIVVPGNNGLLGSCRGDGTLLHTESCELGCRSGFTAVGVQPHCSFGNLISDIECVPNDCTGLVLSENAVWGDCWSNGTLPHGGTCDLQCMPGYTRSGDTAYCSAGLIFNQNAATQTLFDGIVCIEDIDCIGKWSTCDTTCADKTFSILTPASGSGRDCQALHGAQVACEPVDNPWFRDALNRDCTDWEQEDCTDVASAEGLGYTASELLAVQEACGRSCTAHHGRRTDGLCTDDCWSDHDCNGHGTCDDSTRRCECTDDYWGLHCQLAPIPCAGCGEHGSCTGTLLTDTCDCTDGYTGAHCEIDPCGGCSTHGSCLVGATTCTCSDGYTGAQCDMPPDTDCVGHMTTCRPDCGPRVFVVDVEQSGTGAPCDYAAGYTSPCSAGMDGCPPNIDCVGSWSACTSLCGISTFTITQNRTGQGRPCEVDHLEERPCLPGDGDCPLDTDCVGAWSICEPACADAVFTVSVEQSGQAEQCKAVDMATAACELGDGQCGLFSPPGSIGDICFDIDGHDRGPGRAWSTYRTTLLGGYVNETRRVDLRSDCRDFYNTIVAGQCPGIWDLNVSTVSSWDCTVPCARQVRVFTQECRATFFTEMHREVAEDTRSQTFKFLSQATSYADEGNGLALEDLEVTPFLAELRLLYTQRFADVSTTQAAIVDDCAEVTIPPPVSLTELYPTVPFYEPTLAVVDRARGGPPQPDNPGLNCTTRLFKSIPDVCLGIDRISNQMVATWTCSKACSTQWIDGLQYCKTTAVEKFHVPLAVARQATFQAKVEQWERYAALGAVSQSEPDLYGVVPDDEHNLDRQDIVAWYSQWWLDTKGAIMDLDVTLSQMTAKCRQTRERAAELRAAPPPSVQPTAMLATSTLTGPPIDRLQMQRQLEAQHGVGNAIIRSFRQKASVGVSLPGSVADFDSTTPKGQAARYMVRQGTATPLGVHQDNVTINAVGAASLGRRRLQSTSAGVTINVTISTADDVSASLTSSNFSSAFSDSYIGAAATVPRQIARTVSHRDMALLASQAKAIKNQQVAITLPADIAAVYPDDDQDAQLEFRTTARNDIAAICGIAGSRITITEVVGGSAIIRFVISEERSGGDVTAADAFTLLQSTISSGAAPEVYGFGLAASAVELVNSGGVQTTEPSFVTELTIEVAVPPGMRPDDAAELVDQNAILGLLVDMGVDIAEMTVTAGVEEVVPVVTIIEVQVTLDVTIEEVETDRAGFETQFKSSAATRLGVAQTAITITDITAGSVVVSFSVNGLSVSAVTTALSGAILAGYGVTDVVAGTDLAPAVDSSEVVSNTISAEELAGLGAEQAAKNFVEATFEVEFSVGVAVGAGIVTLVGLYVVFFTVGRHRSKVWSQQLAQVVPTGPGARKAKQALEELRARMAAERKMAPPRGDTPDEEEGLGLTRTQMLLANLTEEQIQIVQDTFEMFDADGSGAIDASEMCAAMNALGKKYTKKECKAMIAELDEDGDGDLDIDEFLALMAPMLLKMDETEGNTMMNREQLEMVKAAFETFDEDGSGEIDVSELQSAMRTLGHDMTIQQCKQAIASVDEDESGEIDLNEFIVLMAPIIIEAEHQKLEAQIEAQRLEEKKKLAAIAARKRQAEQDLMDARLRDGVGMYGAGSGVYGETLPDGAKPRHKKSKKKSKSARNRQGYDEDEFRGVDGLPGAAPHPLPQPPKTRHHARGMGGSKRTMRVSEKIETDKNWMLTEAEKKGLHIEEGVNVRAARLR